MSNATSFGNRARASFCRCTFAARALGEGELPVVLGRVVAAFFEHADRQSGLGELLRHHGATGARAHHADIDGALEARGEIFTVPVEKGDARNLTRSSGAADRAPVWSPKSEEVAWFSDAGRGYELLVAAQGGKVLLQTGTLILLARLLSPEDFGLTGMVATLTGFLTMFRDAGLSAATVQRLEVTHEQISTLFWINVAFGALLSACAILLAPAVARFYGDPRLTCLIEKALIDNRELRQLNEEVQVTSNEVLARFHENDEGEEELAP